MPRLRERDLHCHKLARGVNGKRGLHLEGEFCVDAAGTWPVDARVPVPPPRTIAQAKAATIVLDVQSGVEGVQVSLLDVYFRTIYATYPVGVAVIVITCGGLWVLIQRGEVQSCIATALCAGQVHTVAQRLSQQLQRHILVVVVLTISASIRKVSSPLHMRDDAIWRLDIDVATRVVGLVESSVDHLDRTVTRHIDRARTNMRACRQRGQGRRRDGRSCCGSNSRSSRSNRWVSRNRRLRCEGSPLQRRSRTAASTDARGDGCAVTNCPSTSSDSPCNANPG
mmetsp:Transcript_67610/g.170624  ORF Transcript_67610/g.170624 Transcript_67610/m.170624 type:complete len:282 (+) Transcript_67610:352-1197(+)